MTFISIKSSKNATERKNAIARAMHQCRVGTLALFENMSESTIRRQAHPEFSPVGWHLGHIAYTESLWILERCAGMQLETQRSARQLLQRREPPQRTGSGGSSGCCFEQAQYRRLFTADGLPKTERVNLPTLAEVRCYLDTVREKVLNYLETADLDKEERLWRWLIQHESQHSETIAFVLQLQSWDANLGRQDVGQVGRWAGEQVSRWAGGQVGRRDACPTMMEIPGGYFEQGNNFIDALDNERPVHQVYLESYLIDRYPITCGQYRAFIESGGYQNSEWWSADGWEWLQKQLITQPLYWTNDCTWDNHPVYGVSAYEAEAYARFVGKRLPTEAEWEKAASWDAAASCRRTYPWGEAEPAPHLCNYAYLGEDSYPPLQTMPVDAHPAGQSAYGCYDMLGNVWEWTASVFKGYEGFVSYPYAGYSKVYFDGQHYVLRGGSWATRSWALRSSFRNWYYPYVRQILAGFRCAKNG